MTSYDVFITDIGGKLIYQSLIRIPDGDKSPIDEVAIMKAENEGIDTSSARSVVVYNTADKQVFSVE
jgi:hypothetical protein